MAVSADGIERRRLGVRSVGGGLVDRPFSILLDD
jgi:hypothetical protein